MGKLTPAETVREHDRGKKAAAEGRLRYWSEPWASRSNPMNIMKHAGRRSSRALILDSNNTAKTRG